MKNKFRSLLLAMGLLLLVGCASGEETAVTAQPPAAIDLIESTALPPTSAAALRPTPTIEKETETVSAAANANVTFVRAVQTGDEVWTFHVTVAHPDTGWDDYADGWDVVLPDGAVVKPDPDGPFTRLLLHPHETEQPFTRSQSGIEIPPEITTVTVRAHDLVDGFGGQEVVVDLTAVSGPNFSITR